MLSSFPAQSKEDPTTSPQPSAQHDSAGEHVPLGGRDGFEDALWCPRRIHGSISVFLGIGAPFWMIAAVFLVVGAWQQWL